MYKVISDMVADEDFRNAIKSDGGRALLESLRNADERGICFQTLGTEQLSGKTYLETGVLPSDLSKEGYERAAKDQKRLRLAKKKNMPQQFLTADVFNESTLPHIHSVERFMTESFPTMLIAVDEMHAAKEKFKPESFYKTFYENIQAHRSDWRHFFSVENNQYLWAEKVVPLLGNLAMIHRQRRAFSECDQVMAVYKEVLENFEEMIARRRAARLSDDNELVNCRALVYRYHRVVVNLAADTLRFSDTLMASYRALFQFEIDTKFVDTEEDCGFLWIFTDMMGKSGTSAALRATTDREISAFVQLLFMSFRARAASPAYQQINEYPKVELAVCAGCSSREPSLNTFKLCSRCKAVKYCGKDCQVAHYKQHKTVCKARAQV